MKVTPGPSGRTITLISWRVVLSSNAGKRLARSATLTLRLKYLFSPARVVNVRLKRMAPTLAKASSIACASDARRGRGGLAPTMRHLNHSARPFRTVGETVGEINQALVSDRSVLSFLHIGLDILIEKQTISREPVCHSSDPVYVIGMARVALFERGPRVGIGHKFRLGPGKIDLLTETIATVVTARRHGAQIPTCIGCERNRNLWKADPAYIVAIRSALGTRAG